MAPLINFSGLASGIDTNGLISAASDALRQQRVAPHQKKITELEDEDAAFDKLKTKLSELQTLVKNFTTLNGGGVVKQAKSSDETIVTAAAGTSAVNGTYALTVNTLAKNGTYSLKNATTSYSSSTSAINDSINNGASSANRTITVTVGTGSSPNGETIAVALTNTTTLTDFANSINAAAKMCSASVVNVGTSASPDYRVVIVGSNTGTTKGSINVSMGSETTVSSKGFNSNASSAAANASFSISGISGSISRETNSIGDVIPGLTLNLESTGTSTVSVQDDASASISRITDFVNKYNELADFIKENNTVERKESGQDVQNVFSPLAKTRLDDDVLSTIKSNMASATATSGSEIKIMADLGITTQQDGKLQFNSDTFKTALSKEPNSIKTIFTTFGDAAGLTGGTIDQYIRFGGMLDTTTNANKALITSLNSRIADAEAYIAKNEESMRSRFAILESTMSRMQNQQTALSSALAGLR